MPLKPVVADHMDGEVTLHCHHENIWPPVHAQIGDIEELREAKVIDDHKYEQLKTWERVCGLFEMDAGKCYACPLARMETTAGLQPVPKADKPPKNLPPFAKMRRKQ